MVIFVPKWDAPLTMDDLSGQQFSCHSNTATSRKKGNTCIIPHHKKELSKFVVMGELSFAYSSSISPAAARIAGRHDVSTLQDAVGCEVEGWSLNPRRPSRPDGLTINVNRPFRNRPSRWYRSVVTMSRHRLTKRTLIDLFSLRGRSIDMPITAFRRFWKGTCHPSRT